MNRRLQSILLPLALVSLAAGCTDLSNDGIARVGDNELTDEIVADRAAVIAEENGLEIDLDVERLAVTEWINETAFDAGLVDVAAPADIPEDRVAARYDQGVRAAGITCPGFLVTDTAESADAAAAELRAGTDFADVFADRNVDQSLVDSAGSIGCPTLASVLGAGDAPEAAVLLELDADDPVGVAEIVDLAGDPEVWVVVEFRSFADTDPQGVALADATVRSVLALEDIDISVDSRYGYFDPAIGAVLPLG